MVQKSRYPVLKVYIPLELGGEGVGRSPVEFV